MKLTVQIKLLPTHGEAIALRKTLEVVNAAANRVSNLCWEKKEFRQFPMHRLFYKQIRSQFSLSAQVVVRLNAKVADAYKKDKRTRRRFRALGSISYDARILSFTLPQSAVSIWTVNGRIKNLSFVCAERHRKLLELPKGESDLILHKGHWFLNVAVDIPEAQEQTVIAWLGVDLGVVNIARTSDGQTFGDSRKVAAIRHRRWRQRKRLQAKGTKSAARLFRHLSGRERRFIKDTNHCISKQIVAVAERTNRGIVLEHLTHILSRIRARKTQRRILYSWAFSDLQQKIAYKGQRVGIPVKFVSAINSSRTCSECGYVHKKNRPTRSNFTCQSCGYLSDADTNAAREISRRGAIQSPERAASVCKSQLR